MSKVFSVAIDGPVGAGKSCVAKKVAERLNAAYLDTGAMYRAVGLYMLENGVSLEDGAAYLHALYPALSVQDVLDSTNHMVERFYLDDVQAKRGASEMLALLQSRGVAMGHATAGVLSLSARSATNSIPIFITQ